MSATTLAPMLAERTQTVTITVSNACVCRFCTACGITYMGTRCLCGCEGIPEVECYGCTEDACEYVGIVAAQWFAANPSSTGQWAVGDADNLVREGSPLALEMGGEGLWEQRWKIEPWTGGVMSVAIYREGVQVGEPLTVHP